MQRAKKKKRGIREQIANYKDTVKRKQKIRERNNMIEEEAKQKQAYLQVISDLLFVINNVKSSTLTLSQGKVRFNPMVKFT